MRIVVWPVGPEEERREYQRARALAKRLKDEYRATQVQRPRACVCGHGEMSHVAGCFVRGCRCEQFTARP